jgi:hypothetical protein
MSKLMKKTIAYFKQNKSRSLEEVVRDLGEKSMKEIITHTYITKFYLDGKVMFEYTDLNNFFPAEKKSIERFRDESGVDHGRLVYVETEKIGKYPLFENKEVTEIEELKKFLE